MSFVRERIYLGGVFVCVSFQMLSVITGSRVNATAVVCLNLFGLCYKIPYFRSFVLPCLGSGAKENRHLTVLSPPPRPLFLVQHLSPFWGNRTKHSFWLQVQMLVLWLVGSVFANR